MTSEDRDKANQCVRAVTRRFQWIEAMEARVRGAFARVHISHSYPVDIRRELRACLREVMPRVRIELCVEQVPYGYGAAIQGAECYARAGCDPVSRADARLWN